MGPRERSTGDTSANTVPASPANLTTLRCTMSIADPSVDPWELFHPGRVLCVQGPHGTLLRAAVSDSLQGYIGAKSVAVKVVPISGSEATALRVIISRLCRRVKSHYLTRYIGVWPVPGNETWIVTELVEGGSVDEALMYATQGEIEAAVAYVVQQALHALHFLHTVIGIAHGDMRAGNILLDDEAQVKLSDYGVYRALSRPMIHRQCYPGAKLWPPPGTGGASSDKMDDVWELGVTVVELVEGSASLLRARKSSYGTPRCTKPTNWSMALNDFVAKAVTLDASLRPSPSELLQHRFVAGANSRVMRNVLHRALAQPSRPDQREVYDRADIIEKLYRSNTVAMRVPLIHAGDIPMDEISIQRLRQSTDSSAIKQSLRLTSQVLRDLEDIGRVDPDSKMLESSRRISRWLDIASRKQSQ